MIGQVIAASVNPPPAPVASPVEALADIGIGAAGGTLAKRSRRGMRSPAHSRPSACGHPCDLPCDPHPGQIL